MVKYSALNESEQIFASKYSELKKLNYDSRMIETERKLFRKKDKNWHKDLFNQEF